MNLLLFDEAFEQVRLAPSDPRSRHIRKVLRADVGTKVFLGFVGGLRARAEVVALPEDGAVELVVVGTEASPPPLAVELLVGLPRPHTARRILFEAASLGVRALHFCETEHGEPSYASSSLWRTDEWKERLRLGAEQSFGTHVPEVTIAPDLQTAISIRSSTATRIALDNYEAKGPLAAAIPSTAEEVILAVGSERGWSSGERDTFRRNGWVLAHLGARVMRVEAACTAGVAVAASCLGSWSVPTATGL
jgi:RsmE family RNA methyltransferase